MSDIVELHVADSQKPSLGSKVSKKVIYFYGEPGTGKSFLAEGLAKDLNLTLISFDFANGNLRELFGDNNYDPLFNQPSKLSIFTKALVNLNGLAPEKNAVIFINEVDSVLNNPHGAFSENLKAMLLELLDPEVREYELRDLETSVDISRYLFILVGNEKIKSRIQKSALDDRMTTLIHFEGFELEPKKEIARKYFQAQLAEAKYEGKAASEDFSLLDGLMTYSHEGLKQVSLRTPFRVIDLYVNALPKLQSGDLIEFDYKAKLDLFSRDKGIASSSEDE